MAKNCLYLLILRPEQDSNLRPTAEEANPNQARQRSRSPYVALTCNEIRLTAPDDVGRLLTLAPSLALRGTAGETAPGVYTPVEYFNRPLPRGIMK